jgi:3'(2'), 5'-bisphosphate nucleotidase
VEGGTRGEQRVSGNELSDGLRREHHAAADLAGEAGELLLDLRRRSVAGKELGDEGDRLSHELLVDRLGQIFPDDRLRSEEGHDPEPAASASVSGRVWIVDPLDGTKEFSEGRDDWAVHVALAVGDVPCVGAVALPAQGVVLATSRPPVVGPPPAVPRLLVSRTRPPAFMPELAAVLGAETVPMGSAGAKIAAVIQGKGEIYVHAGGQYEWDSAAPVAVALACGLHASRLDGSPLRYAQPDPWLPDLVVCQPSLADQVLGALVDLGVVGPTPVE